MFSLSNSTLTLLFSAQGAELISVKNKAGLEYMWQADKSVWPRHAPVLFPIVGKLKSNCYTYQSNTYTLPQHGFARDCMFMVKQHTQSELVFSLLSNAESKKNYPFDFEFEITYTLQVNKLQVSYCVHNASAETMLYSVGAHPGFRCPFKEDEHINDYYLLFEHSRLEKTILQDGLLSHAKEKVLLTNNRLDLSHALFDYDALVFENNQIDAIELCATKSSHKIRLECANWPYFGIWSKKGNSHFVCLEPWYGIADDVDSTQDLTSKKGIVKLPANQVMEHRYSLLFF